MQIISFRFRVSHFFLEVISDSVQSLRVVLKCKKKTTYSMFDSSSFLLTVAYTDVSTNGKPIHKNKALACGQRYRDQTWFFMS